MLGWNQGRPGPKRKSMVLCPVIADQLYLCDAWGAANLPTLTLYSFTDILNVTPDLPYQYPQNFNYHRIPLVDGQVKYPSSAFHPEVDGKKLQKIDKGAIGLRLILMEAAAVIHQKLGDGKKLLVHCKEGLSRSASICMAYLMIYEKMRYTDAFALISEHRAINPHFNFDQVLKQFDHELYGEPTNTLELRSRSIRRSI